MKILKTTLFSTLISLTVSLLIHSDTFAHFGSKGPFGGSISCAIVYDTTVYLGTSAGGVFISPNSKLLNWTPRPVGLKSGKITALTHSGKYLFVGTTDSGVFIFTGFVGSDRYWNKINTGLTNLKIKSLLAIDSVTALAGTDGSGIYKTINKGATWVAINSASLNTAVITGLVKAGNRILLTAESGGIFKSDDMGATWTDFNDANTLNITGTAALSYNTATDEVLLVNNNGLFKASAASTIPVPVYTSAQTGFPANTAVRMISNNGTDWYLATDKGVFTALASLINWTSGNTGLTSLDVRAVVPFQTRLVAGTYKEGIFKTPALGISWTANNTGYNNLETYSMATSGVAVIVAATEKGVFVSKDLANSYTPSNKGLTDSLHVNDLTFSGTTLYAATQNAGIFISADTGKTWTAFNTGLTTMNYKKIIASSSKVYVFAFNRDIYEYDTSMSMWIQIQTGLPASVTPTSLAFYGTKMLLGTFGNGLYTKTESASTWAAVNTGLTNLNVTSVTTFGSKIFAGTDGAGVFVSDSAVINWAPTSVTSISHTTLMNLNGNKIQAMSTNAGYVFASYRGGLLATSDNGATWIEGGNQFNLPSYTAVHKISFVTTRVFVTSENNGLYSNGLAELPPIGIAERTVSRSAGLSVYPNPSKGTFKLELQGTEEKFTDIVIYNALGELVKEIISAGEKNRAITLDVHPGMYFMQVNTGKRIFTEKILIE